MPLNDVQNSANIRKPNPYITQPVENQTEARAENRSLADLTIPRAQYYRQFMTNGNIETFTTIPVNNDEAVLREIYEIDKEAFADTDPYDSYEDFKSILQRHQLTTYAIKDSQNNVVGYYQLEPIKDEDLYIDSIGMKPEYRRSRKGYQAIQHAWQEILNIAQENSVKTLSLHVNSENQSLVNMYKSLGFSVKETLTNYYENGAGAYFMEMPLYPEIAETTEPTTQTQVAEAQTSQPTQAASSVTVEQTEVEEKPQLSAKEIAINKYKEQYNEIADELRASGTTNKSDINAYVELFSYTDSNGYPILDRKLKAVVDRLIPLEADDAYSRKYYSISQYIPKLIEKDNYDNVVIRSDVVPYLESLHQKGIKAHRFKDILIASKGEDKNGNSRIDTRALNFAIEITNPNNKIQEYNINDIVSSCFDNGEFNEEVADFYKSHCYSYDYSDMTTLLRAITIKKDDGKRTISNRMRFYSITEEINKQFGKIYSVYDLNGILDTGCDIGNYLKYYDMIEKDTKISNHDEIARLIDAATGTTYTRIYGDEYEKRERYDHKALSAFKQYKDTFITSEDNSIKAEQRKAFIEILQICKSTDLYENTGFDQKILDKAIQLKEAGFALVADQNSYAIDKNLTIKSILQACMLNTKDYFSGHEKIEFSEEMFNKIIALNGENKYNIVKAVQLAPYCKEIDHKEGEKFNTEAFDILMNTNIHPSYSNLVTNFLTTNFSGDRVFDTITLRNYSTVATRCEISDISNRNSHIRADYTPENYIIDAFKKLENTNFTYSYKEITLNGHTYKFSHEGDEITKDRANKILLNVCFETEGDTRIFNKNTFKKITDLLAKGHDGVVVYTIMNDCERYNLGKNSFDTERYNKTLELIDQGYDAISASKIAAYHKDGRFEKAIELFNMGLRGQEIQAAIGSCYDAAEAASGLVKEEMKFNDLAYERVKELIENKLPVEIIRTCFDKGKFKDRLFKLAMNLNERQYSPEQIKKLMEVCFESYMNPETDTSRTRTFNYDVFKHITDLEVLGIQKDNIAEVLKSCNPSQEFHADAYEKISSLYNKDYDDLGIAKIIEKCIKNHKFDEDRYADLLKLCAPHKQLQDQANNCDSRIIETLCNNESIINKAKETFGNDVMKYAEASKISGYISLANNCNRIITNNSETFVKDLQERLAQLPSPELKVKRLKVLGALSGKVTEDALRPLVQMIKSPAMTDEQIKIANTIFANDDSYEKQIQDFMNAINVPSQTRATVQKYLEKERLDRQIDRPKPIEEQIEQMNEYAQQMLSNPKIPLDKKLKYIEEYKVKQADMLANPEKYTTPKIYPKTLTNLAKVVQAYVNIPNDDTKFNNSIYEKMYERAGVATDAELLKAIKYDSKYFDQLLVATSDFYKNFKKLITLVKLNPNQNLTNIRTVMPEEGSQMHSLYVELGLDKQIEANLDTIRQFKANNLNFEKWNVFDPELKGEEFDVQIDPEVEYKNLKHNIINEFNDHLFEKISADEREKLTETLQRQGFTLYNNNIFKNGNNLTNPDIGRFLEVVTNYFSTSNYFKSAQGKGNETLTQDEIDGATGFMDHINGFKKKCEDIKNAKNVENLYFRLSDDDNIGRNIFFGNHVGCCNSVESTYAGYSAPLHLLNNFNRGMEIVDKYGNSYGNSLCFFALIDGELALVIDSFEANGKLASNPIVTEKMLAFGKQVCKEMGRPDAKVVVGPRYNNLDLSQKMVEVSDKTIDVIGSVAIPTYCDTVGGKNILDQINKPVNGKSIFIQK
ncbi:MAG: GNAT family N-acetyltransferase [Cyanobacteria bacterium SIG32]|nr:GNAT family N-acetyltransferase [Cyanobacteria bacterium SIG32]